MVNPLLVLREPQLFKELAVQSAIEASWQLLSADYELVSRYGLVRDSWLPDLVAVTRDKAWLVVEVKAVGQCSSKIETTKQICGYATEFLAVHPHALVKLLILGKWNTKRIQHGGFQIQIVSISTIAEYLTTHYAEWFIGPSVDWTKRTDLPTPLLDEIMADLPAVAGDVIQRRPK